MPHTKSAKAIQYKNLFIIEAYLRICYPEEHQEGDRKGRLQSYQHNPETKTHNIANNVMQRFKIAVAEKLPT